MRALALLLLVSACTAPPPSASTASVAGARWRDATVQIPMQDADGTPRLLVGRVCRPDGDAPARLVVIAHGSPPVAANRARVENPQCGAEAPQWFLSHGYVVLMALRRGYGATGGSVPEAIEGCSSRGYASEARETARDLTAMVDFATALPYVRPDGAIVVGHSAGGWGTIGLDSEAHPKVAALVSMAGGRGGHLDNLPNRNCHPENLATAAGVLGRTATTPMLWIYAANDTYFSPSIAESLDKAFTASGGKATFEQVAAYGRDGHQLFIYPGGAQVWGPLMEQYLRQQGAL